MSTSLVNKSIAIESFSFKLDFPPLFLIINTEPRLWPLHLNVCPLLKKKKNIGKTDMLYLYETHGTMFAWFCFPFTRVDNSYDYSDRQQNTGMVCFRTCHTTMSQSGSFNSKPLTNNFALCQKHNPHFWFVPPSRQRQRKRAGISGNSTLKLQDNEKVWRPAHVAGKTERLSHSFL